MKKFFLILAAITIVQTQYSFASEIECIKSLERMEQAGSILIQSEWGLQAHYTNTMVEQAGRQALHEQYVRAYKSHQECLEAQKQPADSLDKYSENIANENEESSDAK